MGQPLAATDVERVGRHQQKSPNCKTQASSTYVDEYVLLVVGPVAITLLLVSRSALDGDSAH